jgi:hypothetical protein
MHLRDLCVKQAAAKVPSTCQPGTIERVRERLKRAIGKGSFEQVAEFVGYGEAGDTISAVAVQIGWLCI